MVKIIFLLLLIFWKDYRERFLDDLPNDTKFVIATIFVNNYRFMEGE